ncbi:MAG: hypothetical protein Q9174_006926 [Haloplaca sp. 1 TL-2023]
MDVGMPTQTATSWYQRRVPQYNLRNSNPIVQLADFRVEVRHIGPGQWDIRHSGGERFRLTLAFNDTPKDIVEESTITDLGAAVESAKTLEQAKSVLFKFLTQFEELESRWPTRFETGTCDLLALCALYQKDLLHEQSPVPARDFGISTIIAQLLRIFVLSFDFFDTEAEYCGSRFRQGSDTCEIRRESMNEEDEIDCSITVRRYFDPRNGCARKSKATEPLGVSWLLEKAIANIQRLILRRRPPDFPGMIYSLCLLELIACNFHSRGEFLDPINVIEEHLQDVLDNLCELYLFCSDGVHPLTRHYDAHAYAVLVKNHTNATAYFGSLNNLWTDGEFNEDRLTRNDFHDRLHNLAFWDEPES